MKIISLNTWGARTDHKKFLNFFDKNRHIADVFCLQEVWHFTQDNYKKSTFSTEKVLLVEAITRNAMIDLFSQVRKILFNHKGFFYPHRGSCFGLATFIKNDIKLVEEGDVFVFKDRTFDPKEDVGNHARNIQYLTVKTKNGLRTIINFYGLWNKEGKGDTEDRLSQSDNIIKFIKNLSNPFIICGDFNLLPDTESLRKFEDFGLRNSKMVIKRQEDCGGGVSSFPGKSLRRFI